MFAQAAKPGSMIQLDLGDLGDDIGSEYFARLVRHGHANCFPSRFPKRIESNESVYVCLRWLRASKRLQLRRATSLPSYWRVLRWSRLWPWALRWSSRDVERSAAVATLISLSWTARLTHGMMIATRKPPGEAESP